MTNGTSADPSTSRPLTRVSESQRGVSTGDEVDGSSLPSISTASYRSPSAARRWWWTSSSDSPGSVRMSTWMSTLSGMTLVLVPPWITVGANVVWVHEYTTRDKPSGSVLANSRSSSSLSSASRNSGGYCMPSTNRRQVSWICVGGRYSFSRLTTSAAVTTALSVRNGCEP